MITLPEIRNRLAKNKPGFASKYNVGRLGIFGSYARNEASPESDIDILVEFKQPIGLSFIDLALELEMLLGQKVDLVSEGGVKPKYLEAIKDDIVYV